MFKEPGCDETLNLSTKSTNSPGIVKSAVSAFGFDVGVLEVETLLAFRFDMTGKLFEGHTPSIIKVQTIVIREPAAGRRRRWWRRRGSLDDHVVRNVGHRWKLGRRKSFHHRCTFAGNGSKTIDDFLRGWCQRYRLLLLEYAKTSFIS